VILRNFGIYRLPNGRELVALEGLQGRHLLYTIHAWERSESPMYESGDNGRLYADGKLTAWDVENLIDTGRTISAPKALGRGIG
jgi:hypothetical protein